MAYIIEFKYRFSRYSLTPDSVAILRLFNILLIIFFTSSLNFSPIGSSISALFLPTYLANFSA